MFLMIQTSVRHLPLYLLMKKTTLPQTLNYSHISDDHSRVGYSSTHNLTSNKDVDISFSNKYAKSSYQKDTTPSPPANKLIKRHLARYSTARYPASNSGPTHSSAGYGTVGHSLIYIITLNNSGYISAATRNYRYSYQQHRHIDRNYDDLPEYNTRACAGFAKKCQQYPCLASNPCILYSLELTTTEHPPVCHR